MTSNGHGSAGRAGYPTQAQQYINHHVNVPPNSSSQRLPHRDRLPTVEQALKLSPFSSILPFSAETIPLPNANIRNCTSVFSNSQERLSSRQQVNFLDAGLSQNSNQSGQAVQVANEIAELLNPDDITDYKFKNLDQVHHEPDSSNSKADLGRSAIDNLSPFARTIYRRTELDHRLPAPVSPGAGRPTANGVKTSSASKLQGQASAGAAIPWIVIPPRPMAHPSNSTAYQSQTSQASPNASRGNSNQHVPALNGRNQTSAQHKPEPRSPQSTTQMTALARQTPPKSNTTYINGIQKQPPRTPSLQVSPSKPEFASASKQTPLPMVVIPPSSAKTLQSDFTTVESVPPDSVSRKRKRGYGDDTVVYVKEAQDQKDIADNAVGKFIDTLEEAFEADNQSQPNSSSVITLQVEGREVNTLSEATHVKLDNLMIKINSFGRLADVPLEDLQRLQSLCLGALGFVDSQDYAFGPDCNCEDSDTLEQVLNALTLGLRACRTILLTMSGGRDEKSLYSEDFLLNIKKTVEKIANLCIIPVVEIRSSAASFGSLSAHKKQLSQVMNDCSQVMGLIAKLLAKEEVAETVITTIEYFAINLMFVENASNDKESVLGYQKFEGLRGTAMDIIAIIFSRYPAERSGLLNEILSSLSKLPTTRQAARQYKLRDGRTIQLVTALIIQLVQASSTVAKPIMTPSAKRLRVPKINEDTSASSSNEEDSESGTSSDDTSSAKSGESSNTKTLPSQTLKRKAMPLCDAATRSAHHVVQHLMHRAQTSSKSGDEPHRNLLDIFIEDLLLVISLPEWPGAEILVRMACIHALKILENPKSLAPAKNMALELLGTMGSAISDLIANTRGAIRNQEHKEDKLTSDLSRLFEEFSDGSLEGADLLSWNGPYHVVAEHLEQSASGDLQTTSAQAYYMAQWAKALTIADTNTIPDGEKLCTRLSTMISGEEWIQSDRVENTSSSQCNIAYALTLLNMDFCRRLDFILKILVDSVTSEQTTVRSRGLKSVTQMLEKDPSILDRARSVKAVILRCATDTSPMVRDAALTLIGKCINLKPALEAEFLPHVLHLINDGAVGVRKRAMKLSRDLYLRNTSSDARAAISDSLTQRIQDQDEGVSELAHQMFEEIWVTPFFSSTSSSDLDAQAEIALRKHLLLIIKTATRRTSISLVLVSLFRQLLATKCKNAQMNSKVLKNLVRVAFNLLVDSAQAADSPKQSDVLEVLTIFARAEARLFESSQLQILQPYIGNLASREDLDILRPVVVVFRCVLPVLSSFQKEFLEEVQASLLKCVSKLSKTELNEVAQCLWAINNILENPESLIKLIASVVRGLYGLRAVDFSDSSQKENMAKVRKYMHIAGLFGKHCDFEEHVSTFKSILPWFKGDSVAELIIGCLRPFATEKQPLNLRAVAVDCIGLICQSKPSQFQKNDVDKLFVAILRNGEPELQEIVLSTFRDFFIVVEQTTTPKAESSNGVKVEDGQALNKLGASMKADKSDEASSLISQYFLEDILPIALASQGFAALSATEVIASINRQGAAFPKQSIPTLVALGTSKNASIAATALDEHRRQHALHETLFEGEYMKGIQEAFIYQSRIFDDPIGFTSAPIAAKLSGLWDVVKTSKAKFQKKFLTNMCARISFEPSKLDMSADPSPTLQFSRFLTENLAFFDYTRLDELLHAITCMENIVSDTGSGVAHSISTEVFNIVVQQEASQNQHSMVKQEDGQTASSAQGEMNVVPQPSVASNTAVTPIIEPARLKQLTTASIILSILWDARTYLRRLYGQPAGGQRREGRGRPATKDLTKAPSRVQGVSAEKLVATIADKVASLERLERMTQQCKDFVELLSVDSEVKVKAEDEDSLGDGTGTPLLDDDGETWDTPMSGASRGTKRRGSLSASATPTKRRGRPPLGRRKSTRKSTDGDESSGEWV